MRFFQFTPEEIENSFDKEFYALGQSYFEQNHVVEYDSLAVSRKEIKILSVVEDSDETPYEQEVNLYAKDDRIVVEGGCSCETCINCEHIVAVILQHIHDKGETVAAKNSPSIEIKNDPTQKVTDWLKLLFQSKQQSDKVESSETFLAYKLIKNSNPNSDDIKCFKTRIIKNGSLGKGTSVDIRSLSYNDYDYSFLTPDDIDILKIMNALAPKHQDTLKLKGNLGKKLLESIVTTNRCYMDGYDEPLGFANQEEILSFSWHEVDSEHTELRSSIKSSEFIIYTTPTFLIKSNSIYNLSKEYSSSFLQTLLSSPRIPNYFLDEVVSTIDKELPMLDIEPPAHYELKKIKVEPKAKIYIATTLHENRLEHSVELSFLYDEHEIFYMPLEESKKLLKDGYAVEIIRSFDKEKSYIKKLTDLGFVANGVGNTIVFMVKDNSIVSLDIWRLFLELEVARLQKEGWKVLFDSEFNLKFDEPDQIVANVNNREGNNWFDLSFDIEVNSQKMAIVPIITHVLKDIKSLDELPEYLNIEIETNHFIKLNSQEILPILKSLFNLLDSIKESDQQSISIDQSRLHLLDDGFESSPIEWVGNKEILKLSQKLKNFEGIEEVELPQNLNATLRDYQHHGLNWLNFLYEYQFSGILADDMGLGKTLQILSHLQRLKEQNLLTKPSLVIMPTSLISNWKSEAAKFTPDLSILDLYGSNRFELLGEITNYDIALTTYQLASKDEEVFCEVEFLYIILDEAQKIKNPRTKMAKSIKTFNSDYRIALSGTPIENHLGELWSIYSFLMPGFLNTLTLFKKFYQTPIEKENNIARQNLLNSKIKPFMLRRTKDSVIDELPDKTEIIKYVEFNDDQQKLYESIRITMEKQVRDLILKNGLERSHITILDALLKLRQVCCHPSLLKLKEGVEAMISAKLELFLELVEELLEEGRKILVFSQFTSMLAIIEEELIKREVRYSKLVGSTKNRESVINEFREGRSDIFLISLKAGGVGLNLVEADTVIHYDPWWNPAAENQATDRAYRIGQTKAVFVYKLIVKNSIEEKILELQNSKKQLQDDLYGEGSDEKLSATDLLDLLQN
ncbi:MAG: DEAD/DEAH box helicase [Campylobacterota bacterium]|nr:DEAD/DEAH box helicase [Campylobacterota bacterium]